MSDETDVCEVLRRAEERGCLFWATDGDVAVSPALFGAAVAEIERLRAWKVEAAASWQGLVELIRPGDLGRMWPEVIADEIEGLRTTVAEDLRYQRKLEAELERLRARPELPELAPGESVKVTRTDDGWVVEPLVAVTVSLEGSSVEWFGVRGVAGEVFRVV